MKQSDLNHLRRLVAWVRCEIGQSPEEVVASYREIADLLGHPLITNEAKQRMVESHDRARRAPKYVRAAVKALGKYIKESCNGPVIDDEPCRPTKKLQVEREAAGGPTA